MNLLLMETIIVWLFTALLHGLDIVTVAALISTLLFCSRKFGHFCKFSSLAGIEGVALFLLTMTQILFQHFSISKFLLTVLLRTVFLGICLYDMKVYVYVKEKHRRDERQDD